MRSFVLLRAAAPLAAVLLGLFACAESASAQALCQSNNLHPPIQLRYPAPPGYSWVAHPNPYCSYGIAGPTDRPGMPVQGVQPPPFVPGQTGCYPGCCQHCCQKLGACCQTMRGWCRGPISPYGYAQEANWVRSPRDFFLQPGY